MFNINKKSLIYYFFLFIQNLTTSKDYKMEMHLFKSRYIESDSLSGKIAYRKAKIYYSPLIIMG